MHVFVLTKKQCGIFCTVLFFIGVLSILWLGSKAGVSPALAPIVRGDSNIKAVALMVNVDWGQEVIPEMLHILEKENVKATFFITGRFAQKYPETVLQCAQEGHEIGNHGFYHPHPDGLSQEQNMKEITDTQAVFASIGVKASLLFAPPYGEHKAPVLKAAESLGYQTILWSVDTIDWQDPAPETIIKRVLKKADSGALILMHPKACTIEALPIIIDHFKKQGFSLLKVSEILP